MKGNISFVLLCLMPGFFLGWWYGFELESRWAAERWTNHATEQCYPYALYVARTDDFSWMCTNERLDTDEATR